MTDAAFNPPPPPPPPIRWDDRGALAGTPLAARLERVVSALANLARPYVLYSASTSSSIATVSIVWMRLDLIAGAAFIAAAWAGVAALYTAKSIEERGKAKSQAEVAAAQAAAGMPPAAPPA